VDGLSETYQFYLHDHLGSVNLVVADDGEVFSQIVNFPFGKERFGIGKNSADYRFTGKELDDESNLMYFEARYYNPVIGKFISTDPIAPNNNTPQGLNLYAYVRNNPLIFIDPTGQIPTATEGAQMSQHVYEGSVGESVGGWTMTALYTDIDNPGFRAGLYSRTADGVTEYAMANAGTEFTSAEDWSENFEQPFGGSEHMKLSISKAKEISQQLGSSEITFVGHSKGGAEAAGNALATNRNALLYNPAAISAKAYGLDTKSYTGINNKGMTAYIVKGDVLNTFVNSWLAKPIDKAVYLPKQSNNPVTNHVLGSVIKGLQEQGVK